MSHQSNSEASSEAQPASVPEPADQTQDTDPGSEDLPLDVVFKLLSNERRRRVLGYLETESSSTTLGTLAERIASVENDKPEAALSSSERKRVYVCLYQCHLPKMDDADVIDFDQDRKSVEIGENADQLLAYLPGRGEPTPTRSLTETIAAAASVIGGSQ